MRSHMQGEDNEMVGCKLARTMMIHKNGGDHMVSDWGPVSDLVSGWGACPIWLGPVSD